MRLRNVKNAQEIIDNSNGIVIKNPTDYKGNWNSLLEGSKKINLEIGCGKGQFLTLSATSNPTELFVGLEMMSSVICRAIVKVTDSDVKNCFLLNNDGANILDYFDKEEVDRIYLNFPDPWPKKRHEKRRLTSMSFIEKYKIILKEDGIFRLKTDNFDLFEYSKETLLKELDNPNYGEVIYQGNEIKTEFEEKYILFGKPIYYIEGKFRRK